jgi:hypothetical protein
LIPDRQKRFDGGLQILHTAEDSSTDRFVIQDAEPALNQLALVGTK